MLCGLVFLLFYVNVLLHLNAFRIFLCAFLCIHFEAFFYKKIINKFGNYFID